jgi:hypothetical protein
MIKPAGALRPITNSACVSSTTLPESAPVLIVNLAMDGESVMMPLLVRIAEIISDQEMTFLLCTIYPLFPKVCQVVPLVKRQKRVY